MFTIGLSGATGHAAAAAVDASGVIGACAQERLTRTRAAGFNASGLPDEAIHAVLKGHGATGAPVSRYVLAGSAPAFESKTPIELISQHLAHAATAYLSS